MEKKKIVEIIPVSPGGPIGYSTKELKNELYSVILRNSWNRVMEFVKEFIEDPEIYSMTSAANLMVTKYLNFNDHGYVHSLVVATRAVEIAEILSKHMRTFSRAETIDTQDSVIILVVAAFLHDLGNSIHRRKHQELSISLALPIITKYYTKWYSDVYKRYAMISQTLHCILSHDESEESITIEAGILKVADGCDMAQGRSRRPYEHGVLNIHSISALVIKNVHVREGNDPRPVEIEIEMDSLAGIFQVEEILLKKTRVSTIKNYVRIVVKVNDEYVTEYLP